MKKKNCAILFRRTMAVTIMCMLSSFLIFSQNITVKGKVIDVNKEPLIGVTIQVQNTSVGTITDIDGNYTLPNVPSNAELEVSYVGMKSQIIEVGGKTLIDVILETDTELLDEVVVVAYGTQKARSVTSAISRINTDELVDIPVANITQKMQGKFAGVQILNNSGEPNGNLSIRVRGQVSINASNNPLVVIDGFPSSSGLETLSPDEIASISILKDAASTTLYGSRAANGVILVTTKQGRAGKTEITFNANYGIQDVSSRRMPDLMNARELPNSKRSIMKMHKNTKEKQPLYLNNMQILLRYRKAPTGIKCY